MRLSSAIIYGVFVFLLSACGVKTLKFTQDDKVENNYVIFSPPLGHWRSFASFYERDKNQRILFHKLDIPGVSYDVEVRTEPFDKMPIDILFDPDGDYEEYFKKSEMNPDEIRIKKEQNITYQKRYVAYAANLKCLGGVFSRGSGGSLASAVTKFYSVTCGYYHETEGKRILRIGYYYTTAADPAALQKDKGYKGAYLPRDKVEEDFKSRVKYLIDSIQIKDLDRDRTTLYDKPFESTQW